MDYNDKIRHILSVIGKNNGRLTGDYVTNYILQCITGQDDTTIESLDIVVQDSTSMVRLTSELQQKVKCDLIKSHDDTVTLKCPTYCGGWSRQNMSSFNWWRRGCPKVNVVIQDVLAYHDKLKDNSANKLLYDPKIDSIQMVNSSSSLCNLKTVLESLKI